MSAMNPNISTDHPVIRQLDEAAINRIAAGEVVERPASAVKELVENAIDAGARRVTVDISGGGKTLIRVADDGCGIAAGDLPLALSRHATSKIDGSDLLDIHTFGFRGEALPSLGAVGRLTICSRVDGADAAEITLQGGELGPVRPAASNIGTTVTLRDLFFATPARLKFLRSDRAEMQAIGDTVKRLAMAAPRVSFELRDVTETPRTIFRADAETGDPREAMKGRLKAILGAEFTENAVPLDAERDGLRLSGFAALPTYSRGTSVAQYLFVNGRPVRDTLLTGALRAAYFDYLSRDRHAAAALFVDCDPQLVDVNVHPAKTQVRFRDPGVARGLVVTGVRHALAEAGHRASSTVAGGMLGAMKSEPIGARIYQMDRSSLGPRIAVTTADAPAFAEMAEAYSGQVVRDEAHEPDQAGTECLPLGVARGQVHENYIIAQTAEGMVIVDQHAAHERLVYEKLKSQLAATGVAGQSLLIPAVIDLPGGHAEQLLEIAPDLARLGLVIEAFGGGAVVVRETPAILGAVDAEALVKDIVDELSEAGSSLTTQARIEAILSRVACHGSVRSGRRMRAEEMNALLREMEATPHAGQCNHGRPTYVELKLVDIEKLFGRT